MSIEKYINGIKNMTSEEREGELGSLRRILYSSTDLSLKKEISSKILAIINLN